MNFRAWCLFMQYAYYLGHPRVHNCMSIVSTKYIFMKTWIVNAQKMILQQLCHCTLDILQQLIYHNGGRVNAARFWKDLSISVFSDGTYIHM